MSPTQSRAGLPDGVPATDPATDSATRPEQPALAVAAVARRLGVAPSTLRTWDRRYGLGPSQHSAGSHRRYTTADVARLLVMRQLTLEGVAPADAARSARETEPALGGGTGAGSGAGELLRGGAGARDEAATPSALVEAAMRADELGCRRLLSAPMYDVETWWTELVEPARSGLAARTVLARPGEDPEWVLDGAALAVLRTRPLPVDAGPPVGERLVLMFATPRERRPLALHVLAAALVDRGVDARVVTGPVERRRVRELVAMAHPVAVVVLTELVVPDLAIVADLNAAVPDLPLFVGLAVDRSAQAQAQAQALSRTVHRAHSFLGLLHEVLAVAG